MSQAEVPEMKLTRAAYRLASIELVATHKRKPMIDLAGHILGVFSLSQGCWNWLLIILILALERFRLYCRDGELKWESTKSDEMNVEKNSRRKQGESPKKKRMLDDSDLTFFAFGPILCKHSQLFTWVLFWIQVACAFVCALLSLTQLLLHLHSIPNGGSSNTLLSIAFDAWALSEASLILVEKCCWMRMVVHTKLFQQVAVDCGFGRSGACIARRFFYESYSRFLEGGDGHKLDMVSFGLELLDSNKFTSEENCMGLKILRHSTSSEDSDYTFEEMKKHSFMACV